MHILKINDLEISNDKPLILISGPCVIESRDHSLKMAESIKDYDCVKIYGGVLPSADPEYVIKHENINFISKINCS